MVFESEIQQRKFIPQKDVMLDTMPDFLRWIAEPAAQNLINIINKDLGSTRISEFERIVLSRKLALVIKLLSIRSPVEIPQDVAMKLIDDGQYVKENNGRYYRYVPASPDSINIILGEVYGQLELSKSVKGWFIDRILTQKQIQKATFREESAKKVSLFKKV